MRKAKQNTDEHAADPDSDIVFAYNEKHPRSGTIA